MHAHILIHSCFMLINSRHRPMCAVFTKTAAKSTFHITDAQLAKMPSIELTGEDVKLVGATDSTTQVFSAKCCLRAALERFGCMSSLKAEAERSLPLTCTYDALLKKEQPSSTTNCAVSPALLLPLPGTLSYSRLGLIYAPIPNRFSHSRHTATFLLDGTLWSPDDDWQDF
mmetsp:Transcript_100719/g.146997  ORF Transcript_100719/g.146997 Transcript_100719/m.146997 type:complete len:171 (+) Transcript_100719:933-1445(+)